MTAYELADWIKNGAPFGKYETAKQAAKMLIQLADRIAELEKECSEWEKAYNWMEIARNAPEKVSSKPVAWMSPDGKVSDTEGKLFHKPLYTHPVKQLSDEEIDEIIKQHDWFSKSWVDMVRAIERKITNG